MLPTISLCMIVRNEAQNIELALKSASAFVDEIIIVDTGSTDNTPELCRKYTDKLYHFTWCDDFSAARNESLKYATKEWILVLDADEILEPLSAAKLKAQLGTYSKEQLFFTVLIYNLSRTKAALALSAPGTIVYAQEKVHQAMRLFRNKPGIRYKYSLHELPLLTENDQTYSSGSVVLHFGYHQQTKERLSRALRCLEQERAKYPEDVYIEYNYARTLLLAEQYTEAKERIEKIIKLFITQKQDSSLLRLEPLYKEYIDMLIDMQDYTRASRIAFSWISRLTNKQDIRPYVALAKALYFQGQTADAWLLLERSQSVLDSLPDTYLEGRREEIPQLNFDLCYFKGVILLEKKDIQAKPYLEKALQLNPDNKSIKDLLQIAGGINKD